MKKKNYDDKHKENNLQHQDGNESVINRTKEEGALIKWLLYMTFKQNFIQYVIDIVTLCAGGVIELEKDNRKLQAKINGKQ